MRVIFILLILIVFSVDGNTQTNADEREKRAEYHARMLKNGVLLVRLKDRKVTVEELKNKGMHEKALEIEQELRAEHAKIIKAIASEYSFSDYYFFYSSMSDSIRAGKLKGVIMDDSLNFVTDIPALEPGTPKGDFYILNPYQIYFEAMNTRQKGFAVLDNDFEQLEDPFPYYVRKRDGFILFRRDYGDMARLLDENLKEFFEDD